MKRHLPISYTKNSIRLFVIFSCLYSISLSPAAELLLPVCWYTFDTTLKAISSGFVADMLHRMRELQKNDELIKEYLAYVDAQERNSAIESEASIENPVYEIVKESSKQITTTPDAESTYSASVVSHAQIEATYTNLIIGGVNAADQFLKPGEIFDHETGTCTYLYHDDRGTIGMQGKTGNTNVRISTDAVSIFNFIHALGSWLFPADDETHAYVHNSLQAPIKRTPAEKEVLHQWCLQCLKTNLVEKLPCSSDELLKQRAEIVRSWKAIQEAALEKYTAALAVAETAERIAQLAEAKQSAEWRIETFDVELDAIEHEQDVRAQKDTSQNKQKAYADSNCSSASPGGKDPKDRDKKRKEWRRLTSKEARELARKMGFREKKMPHLIAKIK